MKEQDGKLDLYLGRAVNVAIIVAACVFCTLGLLHFRRSPAPGGPASPKAGERVEIHGVTGADHRQLEVFALQIGCHFCKESLPFYRKLVANNNVTRTRVVFVFPQKPSEAREYLAEAGIKDVDVEQADLSSVDVTGTPTILLLDSNGVIQKFWVGKLSSSREREVEASI